MSQPQTGAGGRLLLARAASSQAAAQLLHSNLHDEDSNQLSVDTDFDSYWEEEARNPHRNRIRIGRQYQATVPSGPTSERAPPATAATTEHLKETLSFCPRASSHLKDSELEHYFTVAKSLHLFAELVQTRSLLGRDVTIADLNRIRRKEGLSLASVIAPPPPARLAAPTAPTGSPQDAASPPQEQPLQQPASASSSPTAGVGGALSAASQQQQPAAASAAADHLLQPPADQNLMRALSHFISLHHPCHHDAQCKRLKSPQASRNPDGHGADQLPVVSDNLRQAGKPPGSRSRAALKQQQQQQQLQLHLEEPLEGASDTDPAAVAASQEWSREEIELFSKAIEVCGKNFGSIKKEFLPSKSVRSILEYYYIGSRNDTPPADHQSTTNRQSTNRKANQQQQQQDEAASSCSPDKSSSANNNHSQGGGSGAGPSKKNSNNNNNANSPSNSDNNTASHNAAGHINLSGEQSSHHQATNRQQQQHQAAAAATNNHSDYIYPTGFSKPPVGPDLNGLRQSTPKISAGANSKNIDARMSVYNFDDEFKDDSSGTQPLQPPPASQFDPANNHLTPGLGVKPLKAKPIMPNALIDTDSANSNLGSLKFFMDGQLILKLNACQDQQEGQEKCHWVQSGERVIGANSKQKKLTKRPDRLSEGQLMNGSQSNSIVSSFQDDDSKMGADFGNDDDSKESLNSSFSQSSNQQMRNLHQQPPASSPSATKRLKVARNSAVDQMTASAVALGAQQHQQLPSPINYNRLSVDNNNRIKENNNHQHHHHPLPSPLNAANPAINHQAAAAAAAMPWLQANSFAMAAALLGQLPFPPNPAANMVEPALRPPLPTLQGNINSSGSHNLTTSKPMDLSLEHTTTTTTPKQSIQSTTKSSSRSKSSRPKNA